MKLKIHSTKITNFELLCIILVLILSIVMGIYVLNVFMIDKNDNSILKIEDKIMSSFQEYYLQYQDESLKLIGDKKEVSLKQLKETGFLDEDIKDENGNNCMDKSRVLIYKDLNNEFHYTPILECENTSFNELYYPNIQMFFTNIKKKKDYFDISSTLFSLELNGGVSINQKIIGLERYQYSISILDQDGWKDVYNSRIFQPNSNNNVYIQEKLSRFVGKNKIKDIKLKVIASNFVGLEVSKEYKLSN